MEFEKLLKEPTYKPVFISYIDDQIYHYHLLSFKQLEVLNNTVAAFNLSDFDTHVLIFKTCVVSPEITNDMKAGIISSVASFILDLSRNIDNLNEEIGILRNVYALNNWFEIIRSTIILAFPSYKPEEIECFDKPTLLKRFIQAENLLLLRDPEFKRVNFEIKKS